MPAARAMRVVHVSPTYFAPESCVGGGERFAEELSRVMSARVDVRFVSFGARYRRESWSRTYERVILKAQPVMGRQSKMAPWSAALIREVWSADIIHCHQYYVLPTFVAALVGRARGRPVFVSDLGGGGWTPAYHIDQSRWIRAHLPISRYAARWLPGRNKAHHVIHGGVDLGRYPMRAALEHDGSVIALGRILPHKGLHFLIEGLPDSMPLRVVGPIGDAGYYAELNRLAAGKRVEFLHGLDDEAVRSHLRGAMAIVHPTPVDASGSAGIRELFGLAVVEAMASGCVAVVSNAASLPELIEPGTSGLLVPPNNPPMIAAALSRLRSDAPLWRCLCRGGRQRVATEFTWDKAVDRCFEAYGIR